MGTQNDSLSSHFEKFVDECGAALAMAGVSKELGLTGKLDAFLTSAFGGLSTSPQLVSVVQQPKTEYGLPDFSVNLGAELLGYVEFKAVQGKDLSKLTAAHDKKQKELFTSGLQNLIYTNGWQWELWQDSERVKRVVFDAEIFSTGTGAMIDPGRVEDLKELIELFLSFSLLPYSSVSAAVGAIAQRAKALRLALEELGEKRAGAHLAQLKDDFKVLLYRNGQPFKWENFIDSYVQIAAFGALLWRLESREQISLEHRVGLKPGVHPLLYQCLTILWNEESQNQLTTPLLGELVRTINLVSPDLFAQSKSSSRKYVPDPIIHAYEPFFQHYDQKARESFGVFYTPVELVQHIISGVDALMKSGLGRPDGLLDEKARFLDPATGTGTFLLGLANEIANAAEKAGLPTESIIHEVLTERTAAFELFPGPYTIAHQRLETLLAAQGTPPEKRLPIYLTDTLAEPERGTLPMSGFGPAGEHILHEREEADWLKTQEEILVILGNPPYERINQADGGWDRFTQALMQQVVDATPVNERRNLKSATDLFVAFWAWALWALQDSGSRVAEYPEIDTRRSHGIVAFVTNRTWIVGPSLIGLRNLVLRGVKEIWVHDLGGDNRGGSKEFTGREGGKDENVFNIQTGVAIVWLVFDREYEGEPSIFYRRNFGKKRAKLDELSNPFNEALFEEVRDSTTFMPIVWPEVMQQAVRLPDMFAFKPYTGIQSARDKAAYSPWGLEASDVYAKVAQTDRRHSPYRGSLAEWANLSETQRREAWITAQARRSKKRSPAPSELQASKVRKAQYRPLDERYVYDDPFWIDWFREDLHEVYALGDVPTLVSLPRDFGRGPLAMYTELLPEQHSFRGSAGGMAIYPLYRMGAHGKQIGLADSVMEWGADIIGTSNHTLTQDEELAEKIFSYLLAVLSAPSYAEQFWAVLESVPPSVPLTSDAVLVQKGVKLGERLRGAWTKSLDHEGLRWAGAGAGKLGKAEWKPGIDGAAGDIEFKSGQRISGVAEGVWNFTISGYKVLPEYFRARAEGWPSLNLARSMDALKTVAAVRELIRLQPELDSLLEGITEHGREGASGSTP